VKSFQHPVQDPSLPMPPLINHLFKTPVPTSTPTPNACSQPTPLQGFALRASAEAGCQATLVFEEVLFQALITNLKPITVKHEGKEIYE